MKLLTYVLSAAVLTALFATSSFAQSERGSISGTVTDSSGAVVPGAKVVVTNISTNTAFTTSSSATGEFNAPNLQVGAYTVRVDREGFKPALLTGVTANAGIN